MKFTKLLCLAGLVSFLFSCDKDNDAPGPQGPNGLKSLLDIQPVTAGTQCGSGGLAVRSGIDKNSNGKLDTDEVDNTQYVCNGSNASSDKQVIIRVTAGSVYKEGTAAEAILVTLPGFNKQDYPGVDSIVMYAQPAGGRVSGGNTDSRIAVELFNITDNVVIANSIVKGSQKMADAQFIRSDNIYSSLPDKTIDLGVRVTSEIPGDFGFSGQVLMILYRK